MNRYPVWKYAILVIALLVGVLYTLPNFFGEAPAVQVSSGKSTIKVDASTEARVADAPRAHEIVVAIVVTDSGRPLPRVGGLEASDIQGVDGLR